VRTSYGRHFILDQGLNFLCIFFGNLLLP
jgi:hypothetical protein